MANQSTNRPPFCDFLQRYLDAQNSKWAHSQLLTARVGIGRLDEWLKITGEPISGLNWPKLLEFHRFLAAQGTSAGACRRSTQCAKHALRWGIERGELPQKLEDIYTANYPKSRWCQDLPALAEEYISLFEPTRPGGYRANKYSLRVFHTFLSEKNLTYRRWRVNHSIAFVKYLKKKNFEQRTSMNITMRTRGFLRWLYIEKKIKRHPDEILPAHLIPKNKMSLPRPIDPDIDAKFQNILAGTDDIYYKAILLLRHTGIRIAELQKLDFNCIQYDQKSQKSLIVHSVKNTTERRVPIDDYTVSLIKQIQEMSLKNHKKKTQPRCLVIGPLGTPPRYERYSAIMTELCSRLGVKKWINLHALRHTYATSLLNAGISIFTLQKILGHKSIHMTLIYAKLAQPKIHEEYSNALKFMSEKKIAKILESKPEIIDTAFSDIGSAIAKALDRTSAAAERKAIKSLSSRLAKFKMELRRII